MAASWRNDAHMMMNIASVTESLHYFTKEEKVPALGKTKAGTRVFSYGHQ